MTPPRSPHLVVDAGEWAALRRDHPDLVAAVREIGRRAAATMPAAPIGVLAVSRQVRGGRPGLPVASRRARSNHHTARRKGR